MRVRPKRNFRPLKPIQEGTSEVMGASTRLMAPYAKNWRWAPPVFILLLGGFTRFFALGHPHSVVFDEVHFGKHVTSYCCTKERYFDVHPPHAKALMAAAASAAGYQGNFQFERIGQDYGAVDPVALRWFPAFLGAMLPLLIWVVLRQLGASRPAAFFGAVAIALDNALIVQSRMVSLDSTLLATSFGAFSLFLHALKRSTQRRGFWFLAAGVVVGLAMGSKITGLALFVLMAAVVFRPFLTRPTGSNFQFGFKAFSLVAVLAIPVYLSGFFFHFSELTKAGPGDRFIRPTESAWENVMKFQEIMLQANLTLDKTHPQASKPWEWLLDKKPVFYWAVPGRAIFLWGNPVLWWGTALLLCFGLMSFAMSRVTSLKVPRDPRRTPSLRWIALWGFFISYVPLLFVSRSLFLYHYFTPLIFAILYVVLWLDDAQWILSSRLLRQQKSYYVVLGLMALAFLVAAPTTYGLALGWEEPLIQFLHSFK